MKVLATKTTVIMAKSLAVLAVLIGLFLSSNIIIANAHAVEDRKSVQASVTVPDACGMEATDTTHTDTATGGSYKTDFGGIATITVRCNDRNGYSVYAVGYTGNNEGSTDLVGTNPNLTIPTGTGTSTATSHWAMKIGASTSTFTPTILNGYNNYSLVPSTATKVVTYTSDIDFSGTSVFTTSYAVAVAPAQPADTYTGKVKYTVVHPNYSDASGQYTSYNVPVTFAGTGVESVTFTATGYPTRTVSTSSGTVNLIKDATYTVTATFAEDYKLDNWALNNSSYGTLGSTSTNPTTFTPNTNSGSAIITITGKSNKTYMQDLTLADCQSQASSGDITVFDKRDESDYTVRYINGACWMTQNLRITKSIGQADWTIAKADSNFSTNNTVNIHVSDLTAGNSDTEARSHVPTATDSNGYTVKQLGAWYNYCAASAGTVCSQTQLGANEDICPANWHLPSSSAIIGITSYSSAFSPISGGYYNSGLLSNATMVGHWWSSTAGNNNNQYSLYYYNGSLNISSNLKGSGFYIRCMRTS